MKLCNSTYQICSIRKLYAAHYFVATFLVKNTTNYRKIILNLFLLVSTSSISVFCLVKVLLMSCSCVNSSHPYNYFLNADISLQVLELLKFKTCPSHYRE